MYCSQTDLQNSLGLSNLIALSNDLANVDQSNVANINATVVNAKIAEADALIDAKLGQVYDVPLTTALTGTVVASSTAMVGTGTLFTTQLSVNDCILGTDGQNLVVIGITDDTHATLAGTPSPAWSGMTVKRIPALVHYISVTLSCFYLWQRRSTELDTPADWLTRYNRVMGVAGMKGILDQLADEELLLDNYTSVASSEVGLSNITSTPQFDFYDTNNSLSLY